MRWQLRQPLSWKSTAPSATGPLVAPTMSGDRGFASKLGDHPERAPTTQSDPIINTVTTTMATAHGRRRTLRSPLFEMNGAEKSRPPTSSGAARITSVSRLAGMRASTAKYQSRYQSGRGEASVTLGSGGLSSAGGPSVQ